MRYGTPDPDYPTSTVFSKEDLRCFIQDLCLEHFGMDAVEWLAANDCCDRGLTLIGSQISMMASMLEPLPGERRRRRKK